MTRQRAPVGPCVSYVARRDWAAPSASLSPPHPPLLRPVPPTPLNTPPPPTSNRSPHANVPTVPGGTLVVQRTTVYRAHHRASELHSSSCRVHCPWMRHSRCHLSVFVFPFYSASHGPAQLRCLAPGICHGRVGRNVPRNGHAPRRAQAAHGGCIASPAATQNRQTTRTRICYPRTRTAARSSNE